ncbi:flagellar hook-basal body complex protein [Paradesulfitobacterium aromaticivorans]
MMRSLYSAISGLKNHQIRMDVIGNNIANVNTTGYKRTRATFSTALSQTLRGASTPTTQGGTNAIQVGLGAMLASVDQIMTQGSSQSTGNPTDLMLQGPGFFALRNGAQTVYSRAGGFIVDSTGLLVDPASGAVVQDSSGADITIDPTWTSFSIDTVGQITGVSGNTTVAGQIIGVASFSNPAGLTNVGGSFYKESNNSGTPTLGQAGDAAHAETSIVPNALEMSNVDLSQEFTDMIVTQRGFQANSRVITVSDTLLQELIDLKRS